MTKKQKTMLARIVAAAVLLVVLSFLPLQGVLRFCLYLIPYLLVGYDILRKAGRGILNGRVFDENFLMAVASLGAFALAVYDGSGDYTEAAAVMLFYQVGELFQSCAVGKSRRNIAELMDIRPDSASLETDGGLVQVDPEEVPVGSVIVVQPGERVPLDGTVIGGRSVLDTAALTGESLPREIAEGETVLSGCINLTGVLRIETTKAYEESTVSRILELVENASSRKSRSEVFISRFARIYTPAVCCCALALAVLPPLVSLLLGRAAGWSTWIYRALTFLVISCPCALVISIPLTFFAGIGGASHEGVLVKGSSYLELLSRVTCVVFDKTGTLTRGVFAVTGIHHSTLPEEELLDYAAHAECASSHPVSRSLQEARGEPVDRSRVSDIQEYSGKGILAAVDGKRVAIGNGLLMDSQGVPHPDCHTAGTVLHVAIDGEYAGHIVLSDVVRPTSAQAIAELKKCGVEKTVMLTGDTRAAAEQTAAALGLDGVYSGLLPADKVAKVEELLAAQTGGGRLAFVGDGINDAPVLSRADIGIAMGAMGSDAAIEAADVVLMDDDPMKIVRAIRISRKCTGIVRENIVFALGVKFACLILGALGMATMWAAIFADVGVMILAVLNAIRALRVRDA